MDQGMEVQRLECDSGDGFMDYSLAYTHRSRLERALMEHHSGSDNFVYFECMHATW